MHQSSSLCSRQLPMITNDILVEIVHRRSRRRSIRSGSSDLNQLGIVHRLFIIRVLNDAVIFEDDFFVVTKARTSFNQLVVVESRRGEVFFEASRSQSLPLTQSLKSNPSPFLCALFFRLFFIVFFIIILVVFFDASFPISTYDSR